MIKSIEPYWKAVVAFIAPGLVVIGSAITAGSDGGTRITTTEFVSALIAMFVTSGVVYATPNKDKRGRHQTESVQPPTL